MYGLSALNILVRGVLEAPKPIQVITFALDCPPELNLKNNFFLLKKITCIGSKTWINQIRTEGEAASILASFHSAGRWDASC